MALPTLNLTLQQSNDARYLTLVDATGETDTGGWGVSLNDDYDTVVSDGTTGNHLTFTVTVTDKNGDETAYQPIDLHYKTFGVGGGTYTQLSELTWTLYASDFITVDDSTAMGTSDDRLIDGIWDIEYRIVEVTEPAGTEGLSDTYDADLLVDGDVRADTFDALREITRQYDNNINDEIDEIMEALLKYAYLGCIEASGSVSERDNLINMLWTLDKLNSDGSKYDW